MFTLGTVVRNHSTLKVSRRNLPAGLDFVVSGMPNDLSGSYYIEIIKHKNCQLSKRLHDGYTIIISESFLIQLFNIIGIIGSTISVSKIDSPSIDYGCNIITIDYNCCSQEYTYVPDVSKGDIIICTELSGYAGERFTVDYILKPFFVMYTDYRLFIKDMNGEEYLLIVNTIRTKLFMQKDKLLDVPTNQFNQYFTIEKD